MADPFDCISKFIEYNKQPHPCQHTLLDKVILHPRFYIYDDADIYARARLHTHKLAKIHNSTLCWAMN